MSPQTSKLLVQVLRKIPIFKSLSPSQVKKILGLCVHKSYKLGSQICRSNTSSDEMYILLSGELIILPPRVSAWRQSCRRPRWARWG